MKNKAITINVMAPLLVGDPADIRSSASQAEWRTFDEQLRDAKSRGITGVSTDVWWGLVEPVEGEFNFSYYDELAKHITDAGLLWIPIISLHQCGGNVGDGRNFVPIPSWVWTKLAKLVPSGNADAVRYVSEQGNSSSEYVSAFATYLVLANYRSVFRAFRDHFAPLASKIAEINVSLGPAGELRYPSYNSHDKGTDWPNRGALQCYGELAIASFRTWVLEKYKLESEVAKAWGLAVLEPEDVAPPVDASDFFKRKHHLKTVYGRDLLDWYADSLISHGRQVMNAALEVFGEEGHATKGIDLGAKIPGVHWRMGEWLDGKIVLADRLAEIPAGLIRTSGNDWTSDADGHGYKPLVSLFAEFNKVAGQRVVLHFTCLEMTDGADGKKANSLAQSLVRWVGAEAVRQGVPVKGENALSFTLPNPQSWLLMRSALDLINQDGVYEGLTLLRMSDVLSNDVCKAELEKIMRLIRETSAKVQSQGPPVSNSQSAAPVVG